MGNYKELQVWQKSIDFVTEIYKVTGGFSAEEKFGLMSQIRRASVSIASNIAEGNSRRSALDYIQFLKIARGSAAEVETQIIISKNLGFIKDADFTNLSFKISELLKMLNGLINYLKTIT